MLKIDKKIVTLFLSTTCIFANDIVIEEIGINLGKSYTSYKQKNNSGAVVLDNNPDKTFNELELYTTLQPILGICKEYDMKPTLSYTYSKNSELKHQYLLAGLNKYYTPSSTKLNLYAGVLVGYGQIDWSYNPLNSTKSSDTTTNSSIYGLQAGMQYPINKKYDFTLNTKYLVHDYETDLKPSNTVSSTIEHKYTASIGMGIVYRF